MATNTREEAAQALRKIVQQPRQGANEFRQGTVSHIDAGGVAWVVMAGDSEPSPCKVDTSCKAGDTVTVRVTPTGRAYVAENTTDPAASRSMFVEAKDTADEALEVATATGQHFWDDDIGAHVTDVTKREWKQAEETGFEDVSKPYFNSLWNSLGMLFRTALTNLVGITRSAISFYDGEGNEQGNIVASFGKEKAVVGRDVDGHAEITDKGMSVWSSSARRIFSVSAAGNESEAGQYVVWETFEPNVYEEPGLALYYHEDMTVAAYVVWLVDDIDGKHLLDSDVTWGTFPVVGDGIIPYDPQPGFSNDIGGGKLPVYSGEDRIGNIGYAFARDGASEQIDYESTCAYVGYDMSWDEYEEWVADFNDIDTMVVYAEVVNEAMAPHVIEALEEALPDLGGGLCVRIRSLGSNIDASGILNPNMHFSDDLGSYGRWSVGLGEGVRHQRENQVVVGRFNADADAAFVVGNGTSDESRSNAMMVGWSGDIYEGGVKLSDKYAAIGSTGTSDYTQLTNKPSIGGVTLQGDKSFPDLGIFIEPEEPYPQSDDYALTTQEITALWNIVQGGANG